MTSQTRIILTTALILTVLSEIAPARGYSIPPQETDPAIMAALTDHYVVNNPWVARRDVLFLFFPGTKSRAASYRLLTETAADLGFHAISLQYVNDASVNTKCYGSRNLECYENMRREILFGSNFSPHVNVNRANSAENRLIKLLKYLMEQYPLDGWERYLTAQGVPYWSRIMLAGHSQGGGHAAMLGKYYSTAGVVMFASMDYSFRSDRPGAWINNNSNTRPEKFFAVAHTHDLAMPITAMRRYWNAFGFRELGPVINIDHIGVPYANSNTLITSIKPARVDRDKSNYHNALCMDIDTPKTEDGEPLLRDLWVYMLTAPLRR